SCRLACILLINATSPSEHYPLSLHDALPIFAGRHSGQQVPVLGWDLHHVVDPGIVPHFHLRQPEVCTLTGVPRHDVVDDDAAVRRRHLAQATELQFGAEHLVDLRADPVEVPINAGGRLPAKDTPGTL